VAQVDVQRTGYILTLTINRPDKKNALTDAMYGALVEALEAAEPDPEVRCVIITGAGDVFTAGNDLSDFAAVAAGQIDQADRHVHRLLYKLASFEKPLIAAVPGLAVGIGTTMLLHCDLVFLAETAQLSTPFVNLALVPEAASSVLLPARIGHVRAFAMFALGEKIDAATALAWGLANRVVASAELQATAMAAAEGIAQRPAGAIMATKKMMRDRALIEATMATEGEIFTERLRSPEAREAFTAFAERRQPDFSKL
jgi:enoyl-CoA hydratase/carnithine racemase